MSALAGLLATAIAVEDDDPEVDATDAWPEELEVVATASESRRNHFALGRACARLAIERLGAEPRPILPGARRQPIWPRGVVGSITHTSGYVAAAATTTDELAAVGIDAEPDIALPAGVLRRIARPEENAWIDAGGDWGVEDPGRLLFCAKEAIYKVWYPLAHRWLGFADATVEVDAKSRSFRADILADGPLDAVVGRYAVTRGVIVTSIEVAASSRRWTGIEPA